MTAPILAGIAFALSVIAGWGALLVFVAFVLFMSSCCCSMTKGGLITTGIFGAIAGATSAIAAFIYFSLDEGDAVWWDDDDDYYNFSQDEEGLDNDDLRTIRIVGGVILVGAVLWFAAATLLLVFACSRYDKLRTAAAQQAMAQGVQMTSVQSPQPGVVYASGQQPYTSSASAQGQQPPPAMVMGVEDSKYYHNPI